VEIACFTWASDIPCIDIRGGVAVDPNLCFYMPAASGQDGHAEGVVGYSVEVWHFMKIMEILGPMRRKAGPPKGGAPRPGVPVP
jgi:hypothetical protein